MSPPRSYVMKLHLRSTTGMCRTGLALTAAMISSTIVFGCAELPDSATDPAGELADVTHPEADTAGSQIRLHEGSDGTQIEAAVTQTPGMDVSSYQGNVNWSAAKANGGQFAY